MIIGVDGTLIRKDGKGISRFLISFLETFALNSQSGIELVVFVAEGVSLPSIPKHHQIQYIPVSVSKQIIWDLWGFEGALKSSRCNRALTLNDRVNISCKYLLYYFEVPDHRIASNCKYAGWYQKISDRITSFFLKRTFAKADHIAVSSAFTKNDLIDLYNVPEEKVFIAYPGPQIFLKPLNDFDRKQSIQKKYNAKKGYILHFSSNNDPRDNTGTLLKAFALSLSRIPSEYKMVICGVDELRSFGWGETLSELGLKNRVVCTGFLSDEDLLEIYQGADLYVDTSLYEGFGYQVAEAMTCGVPVVCSDTSSLPEVAGDAAVYIDNNDPKNIADTLVAVINDQQKMKEMSEASLKQVKKFSLQSMTKNILEIMRINNSTGCKYRGR